MTGDLSARVMCCPSYSFGLGVLRAGVEVLDCLKSEL
jgi:hypothetical protein